jgi:hypothetical protein
MFSNPMRALEKGELPVWHGHRVFASQEEAEDCAEGLERVLLDVKIYALIEVSRIRPKAPPAIPPLEEVMALGSIIAPEDEEPVPQSPFPEAADVIVGGEEHARADH